VESGEFRAEANELYLQLLTAPVLISTTWNLQFREHAPIEIDKYMQMHIDFVLRAIKA
jgi:hypothetical protein